MWSRSILAIVAVVLGLASTAQAADGYVYESEIHVPQPEVTTGDPGQAIFATKTKFSSVTSVCLHVWFDPSDPLDLGDMLRFTPNSWFDENPFAAGPGFQNVSESAQLLRTICVVSFPALPPERFLLDFADGHQVFKLTTDVGSVIIDRIDVEITGSTS